MLVLASSSPRRKELLGLLVKEFDVSPANIDETPREKEKPLEYVLRMAVEKAVASISKYKQTSSDLSSTIFLASDTSVVVDSEILGKPIDLDDSKRMLKLLSGRSHQVITSVCVCDYEQVKVETHCVVTEVCFRQISDVEIQQYWDTGEPQDKAGSYAIQGLGAIFVKSMEGSYSAVVGLPLYETSRLLAQFGIHSLKEMSYE